MIFTKLVLMRPRRKTLVIQLSKKLMLSFQQKRVVGFMQCKICIPGQGVLNDVLLLSKTFRQEQKYSFQTERRPSVQQQTLQIIPQQQGFTKMHIHDANAKLCFNDSTARHAGPLRVKLFMHKKSEKSALMYFVRQSVTQHVEHSKWLPTVKLSYKLWEYLI